MVGTEKGVRAKAGVGEIERNLLTSAPHRHLHPTKPHHHVFSHDPAKVAQLEPAFVPSLATSPHAAHTYLPGRSKRMRCSSVLRFPDLDLRGSAPRDKFFLHSCIRPYDATIGTFLVSSCNPVWLHSCRSEAVSRSQFGTIYLSPDTLMPEISLLILQRP
jgi:hypothetical protein